MPGGWTVTWRTWPRVRRAPARPAADPPLGLMLGGAACRPAATASLRGVASVGGRGGVDGARRGDAAGVVRYEADGPPPPRLFLGPPRRRPLRSSTRTRIPPSSLL